MRFAHARSGSLWLTALCYLFPFLTITCAGMQDRSFTGVQLAIGTTIEEPQMFGPARQKQVEAEPYALIAVSCAVIGALAALVSGTAGRVLTGLMGALQGLFLLLLQSKLRQMVATQGQGMLSLRIEAGYWIALIACGFAVLLAFVPDDFKSAAVAAAPAPPVPPSAPPPPPPATTV